MEPDRHLPVPQHEFRIRSSLVDSIAGRCCPSADDDHGVIDSRLVALLVDSAPVAEN
jgi:hypothetical protein